MFKLSIIALLLIKGLVVSGYFAFFRNKPIKDDTVHGWHNPYTHKTSVYTDGKWQIVKLDGSVEMQLVSDSFNKFVEKYPSELLHTLVDDLNWLINNKYDRDIRVKRVIHQDLEGLTAMMELREKLERPNEPSLLAYEQALNTITTRVNLLRHTKDQTIRDEILMLGDLIKRNDR
tara:strand:+ start:98 stop:622 length:525 start_codon:yes stop_codon:yes gene_type:complete